MARFLRRALGLALAATCASAMAASDPDTVEITALRHPVDKSYRQMVKGMELFEARRAMAPAGVLRYKLLPRKSSVDLRRLEVEVIGETFQLHVRVAADQTFALGRYPQALEEDARVRAERQAQTLTWRAEVRTPGLPENARRLGDLRLECQVGMRAGLVSDYPRSFIGRLLEALRDPGAFCNDAYVPYLFFAERPLFSVVLSAGARRQTLSVGQLYAGMLLGRSPMDDLPHCDCALLLDRAYLLPLGDPSWPDDTRVELEYMDAPPVAEDPLRGWSKSEVAGVFGEPRVMRFASGLEVWAYQFGSGEPFAKSELVVLFAAADGVLKSRVR